MVVTTPTGSDAVPVTRRDRWVVGLIVAVLGIRSVAYLVTGSGLLMSDWTRVASARLDGLLAVSYSAERVGRPGAAIVSTLVYGVIGAHPILYVVLLTALCTAVAYALFRLLERFVDRTTALLVAVLWAALPTSSALLHWPATAAISVGLLLALVGANLLDQGRWVGALVLFVEASLCTELVLPVAIAAAVVLPRSAPALERRARGIMLGTLVLTGVWILAHPSGGMKGPLTSLRPIWSAHFGLGVAPNLPAGVLFYWLAFVGISFGLWRLARGDRAAGGGPWLVGVGVGVIALGVVPILANPTLAPRGLSSGYYAVSSIGAALVWVGLAGILTARRQARTTRVVAVLGVVFLTTGVFMARGWGHAADDARAVVDVAEARARRGDDGLVVGPAPPYRDGVTGLAGRSNSEGALALRIGTRRGSLWVVTNAAEFEGADLTKITWDEVLGR